MFQKFDPMLRTNGGSWGAEPPWRGVWGAEPPSKPLHHNFLPKKQKSQLNHLGKAVACFRREFSSVFLFFFETIGQNGRPGRREPPRSISFDEASRIKSVWGRRFFGTFFIFFCRTKSARTGEVLQWMVLVTCRKT